MKILLMEPHSVAFSRRENEAVEMKDKMESGANLRATSAIPKSGKGTGGF